MNGESNSIRIFLFIFIIVVYLSNSEAQDLSLKINTDLVSRYIWRGLNVNNQPNIQPAVTFEYTRFKLGLWGSYGLNNQNLSDENYSVSQEIDTWLGYSFKFDNRFSIGIIFTDYYYPVGGQKICNFKSKGAGAHTIEGELNIIGPESFPLSLGGYINIYNDKGNNIYIQTDYSLHMKEVELEFFAGAAVGSQDNSGYYGTEKFNVINVGIKASKQIKITADFSLPIYCSYILNPQVEISYLVFGISIS
jgi:hypothetical protein